MNNLRNIGQQGLQQVTYCEQDPESDWVCVQENCNGTNHYYVQRETD